MKQFQKEVAQLLHTQLLTSYPEAPLPEAQILELLEKPQRSEHGDIAFPCFLLAKALKKAPPQISQEIATKLSAALAGTNFESAVAMGPYVNFRLSAAAAFSFLQKVHTEKDSFGTSTEGAGKKILLEYSSPNVAKEFHIGHFRNTVLGQSLNNLYKASGHEVISINHLGDWGAQFGVVLYAFLNYGNEEDLKKSPIDYLTKLYVQFHEEQEKNPELTKEARLLLKKLELGDENLRKLWKRFVDLSIEDLKKAYARLGVSFDHYLGESFYEDKIPPLLDELKRKNLLVESQGAQIVDLEAYKMPPCLVVTTLGTTLYAARDLAAALYRYNRFQFDECYYVIGSEQQLHTKQFFQVLKLMGYPWANHMHHVAYGLYRFKDGKFSTRKGRVILMKEVIDEAKEKVLEIIEAKNPSLANKNEAAESVALGAIIFNDLSTDRVKDVEFDWARVLDFEGDTGPYLQYSYARAASILRQAKAKGMEFQGGYVDAKSLAQYPAALALVKQLGQLSSSITGAVRLQKPSIVANYALDLAKLFNGFYRQVKVLDESASKEETQAKLSLVAGAQITMRNALSLLCIRCPEEM